MRADTAFAWALAALGVPVIVTLQLGLTGAPPGLRGILVVAAAVVLTALATSSLCGWLASRTGDGGARAVPGLAGRTVVAALALGAGQLALALVDAGARTEGCLPVVGQGARVGYGWLTLRPVVPCADGAIVPAPLTLAAVGAALAAVAVALAAVAAHLSVAFAAAFVGVRFAVAGALIRFARRVDPARLSRLFSATCPAVRPAPSPPRQAPAPIRPRRRPWTIQLSHRGPPMTLLPHLA